jgi:glutamine---fructose-6-phosphate transaminase (isomerizing)
MSTHSEILEQPERLRNLLSAQRRNIEEVARGIAARNVQYVFLAARGTSDNAGRYANYLWGAMNGLPLALATPSLFTYYQRPPKLTGALVVGISQSGQSPDIVSVLTEGKRQGCATLAITNAPDSALGRAADYVIDVQAGPELSVAATKTYTSELMSIAMLSTALSGNQAQWPELERVPEWLQEVLKQDPDLQQAAARYRYMQQCVVLGRGYNYATAFEWALKLKEMTYVEAEAYSSADFQHGPLAIVAEGFPVMAVAPEGKVTKSVLELLSHLKQDLAAELVVISNLKQALALAQVPITIPSVPEWLSPLISIVPAQLLAYHLTIAKGINPEKPRSLRKVTETN